MRYNTCKSEMSVPPHHPFYAGLQQKNQYLCAAYLISRSRHKILVFFEATLLWFLRNPPGVLYLLHPDVTGDGVPDVVVGGAIGTPPAW